jgi:hypothetical protein
MMQDKGTEGNQRPGWWGLGATSGVAVRHSALRDLVQLGERGGLPSHIDRGRRGGASICSVEVVVHLQSHARARESRSSRGERRGGGGPAGR